MRKRLWQASTLMAVLLLLAVAWPGAASNEIARREGQLCTACHDKPGSKLLTDEGKYYELMRTLEGYEEVTVAFGDCTSCHVRRPGSHQLTEGGERFAELVGDMEGLRRMLVRDHPVVPAEESGEEPKSEKEPEEPAEDPAEESTGGDADGDSAESGSR